uniref:Uncharacterized protein n=1 Tax=Cannabis sativa TaxID=3483 RepID=A0A803NJF6_CANSA
MATDLNVQVPVITRIPMNTTYVETLAISVDTKNQATIACKVNTTNPEDLNNWPLPPREDPPLSLRNEGRTHMEQLPCTITRPHP